MAEIDVAADPPLGPQPFDGSVHVDSVPGDDGIRDPSLGRGPDSSADLLDGAVRGLSSNGTEMYAKGVDRYLPEMRLRRIQE